MRIGRYISERQRIVCRLFQFPARHHPCRVSVEQQGSKRNVVFASLGFFQKVRNEAAVGAVGTVGKPERFLRRLFQAACGNHQEEVAEGHLCRFPQLRQFPQRFSPAVCPLAGSGKWLENSHPLHRPCSRSSFIDDFRGHEFCPWSGPDPCDELAKREMPQAATWGVDPCH